MAKKWRHCWSPIGANSVQNAAQQYLIIIFNDIESPAGLREFLPQFSLLAPLRRIRLFAFYFVFFFFAFAARFAVHVKIICIIRYYFRRSRNAGRQSKNLPHATRFLAASSCIHLTNGKLQQKTEEDKTNMCKPLLSSLTICSRFSPCPCPCHSPHGTPGYGPRGYSLPRPTDRRSPLKLPSKILNLSSSWLGQSQVRRNGSSNKNSIQHVI